MRRRFSTSLQISLSLVSITVTLLMLAHMVGLIPRESDWKSAARMTLLRSVATQASLAAQASDPGLLTASLKSALLTVPDLVGCRLDAPGRRQQVGVEAVDDSQLLDMPLYLGNKEKGLLQFHFQQPAQSGLSGIVPSSFLRFVIILAGLQLPLCWLYLRHILYHLDPSRTVPERVTKTLDALAEGLVVLDKDERIVLANRVFSQTIGKAPGDLIGMAPSSLPWGEGDATLPAELPWLQSLQDGTTRTGNVLRLSDSEHGTRTFRVNTVPLLDERGQCSGAMASFDDVTALEERTVVLTRMLARLKASRDQIRRQNQQLHLLATRDPLTSALNRRSFFEQFEKTWQDACRLQVECSCIILDVDHFKQINDLHGHAKGDMVLKQIVTVLHHSVRSTDLVCRYGGEEFCILMPSTPIEAAATSAERFRHEIRARDFDGLHVTVSFGVSSSALGAESTQKLMDQADRALYAAKNSGRNRVARFDEVPGDFSRQSAPRSPTRVDEAVSVESPISFQIVTALTSALAYRDAATAEHSRRVADLCVKLARGLMPLSQCYILENAALLHDIGKIGIPDSILLKPGALSDQEWSIMRAHDEIGVEIIRSTFACDELTAIVCHHHSRFGDVTDERHHGEDISLGARILTICDAYDAMVTDRVYRPGRSHAEAIAELRRCAGYQFDPRLVERFADIMHDAKVSQNIDTRQVSKTAALRLGVQIESLARAIDNEDLKSLRELTRVVYETAEEFQVAPVAELASQLEAHMDESKEWVEVLQLTLQLMEMCRQTQRSHLATQGQPAPRGAI